MRKMELFARLCVIYSVFFRLYTFHVFCQNAPPVSANSFETFDIAVLVFLNIANDMRRIMTLFCFVLLYCRTRVMKIALDAIDFNDSIRDRFAVNRLIQMYEALVDTLKYIGYPFKVAVCIYPESVNRQKKTVILEIFLFSGYILFDLFVIKNNLRIDCKIITY
ncbi:hypothetical protein B5X24_HaOG200849 [Helicoverpa armigera]|uniref:Uncharacterized protein n=1 Tax=Helicoverpa armigera TaxID=29058 RepID=A0A2W1BJU2_HELAM|nr:hypothetical protein B5X24_HaOG200849 [Helicoverpa armigera]